MKCFQVLEVEGNWICSELHSQDQRIGLVRLRHGPQWTPAPN